MGVSSKPVVTHKPVKVCFKYSFKGKEGIYNIGNFGQKGKVGGQTTILFLNKLTEKTLNLRYFSVSDCNQMLQPSKPLK